MIFQSTLPVWGATVFGGDCQSAHKFQSTLPVWGATDNNLINFQPGVISIHAPRVGSDSMMPLSALKTRDFNPRSPCGERPCPTLRKPRKPGFQSTLPVWGATKSEAASKPSQTFQSTLPVWGATRGTPCGGQHGMISIHAPRVGSDWKQLRALAPAMAFQSTLPVWGATRDAQAAQTAAGISIHAPRVGSDRFQQP